LAAAPGGQTGAVGVGGGAEHVRWPTDENGAVRDDGAGGAQGALAEDAPVAEPGAVHEDGAVADRTAVDFRSSLMV
jgi:hypothetical protein